ncbi:Phytosulfokines 3 [Acorus calamus]|uniref:Phytosulfokine n=1 Tax=Acorus calamus TaxID=4465 RepID=A0AAV9CWG4_ACOCL|nr:Phytosulfokines 3 [Acorus calamus]
MSKYTALFVISLLLFVSLTTATRAGPSLSQMTQQEEVEEVNVKGVEDVCEGVGEEECLMRRTLIAHTDYIYTQEKKP